MTCENCKFWKRHEREEARGSGLCRRYPPQITTRVYTNGPSEYQGRDHAEVESSTETEWPETKAGEWCGEHFLENAQAEARAAQNTNHDKSH